MGYEGATTNAIAARAGISPGSLYQYFAHRRAIAEALAERYLRELGEAHAGAFDATDVAGLSLDEVLDRVVDPIVAFNVAHPGLKALFAGPDLPAELATAIRPLQEAVSGRVEAIIAARAPGLPGPERRRSALVVTQIVRALLPPITAAQGDERAALIAELKRALRGYLAPLALRA